ncbi:uncharacterized protein ColSpa_05504 [Colletotrichum spaethianum]|uniref:Uncharacterized protein n=1 Tax=Colletotrichum spaethianum TaxID=700344 RepID=A0AA37P1T3_9PEZI|nr:uncharacterized protein ColSpa_05504 [Colletotrichum spaethianum]GKT45323.1 hypothetical protein ColSpa_05504 [Colletotrichum spaethianum]
MIASGNLIAEFRKNEMQKLEEMLVEFQATQPRALSGPVTAPTGASWQHTDTSLQASVRADALESISQDALPVYREFTKESSSQAEDLTTQQIIDVVNSMEWEDNEWMSFTMVHDET